MFLDIEVLCLSLKPKFKTLFCNQEAVQTRSYAKILLKLRFQTNFKTRLTAKAKPRNQSFGFKQIGSYLFPQSIVTITAILFLY